MPAKQRYLDSDMVTVYETGPDGKKQRLATLLWGDVVKVIGKSDAFAFDRHISSSNALRRL
ncbi:MAG: hypothetical protein ACT4O1_15130 [Gemmatimonadota bacterium]